MTFRFILVILLVSQTILCEPSMKANKEYMQARQMFRKMSQTELGREAIIAIQAQLTSEDENLVDKILIILKSLLENNQNDIKVVQEDLARAEKEQENRNKWNVKSLTQLKDKIASMKERLVSLEDRNQQLEADLKVANKQAESFKSTLGDLIAKNEAKIKEFEASQKEHDDIIEALQKARELIMRLSTNERSFLQVGPETILAEVQQHIESVQNRGLNQKLLELTLKLSKANIQADQEKVATVIQIIDDLLEFEAETKGKEYQIEQKRRLMFDSKKAAIKANEHRIDGQQKEAFADHKVNQIRIEESSADISGWEERIGELNGQQEDLDLYYNQRLSGLRKRLDSLKNFNEQIQKVIKIFESDKIQNKDVKNVANVNV